MIWHTRNERKLIREFGGRPLRKTGTDGVIFDNRPVEVREARKDSRLRIQQDTHRQLMKAKGYYIFAARGKQALLFSASQVNTMLPPGRWMKDRTYPHKFLNINQIW